MASESQATTEMHSSTQNSRNGTFSIFIPLLFSFTSADPDENSASHRNPDENSASHRSPDENSANHRRSDGQNQPGRDRVILVNPLTQEMVVIEGAGLSMNTMLGTPPEKVGPPPAAKSAIEAMPSVEIGEDDNGECTICLEGYRVDNGEGIVKEMPCKHRFHGRCIEKWLGMHGSCPVCRYAMPAEEEEKDKKGEDREERRRIWVSFSFGGMRRTGEERESGGDFSDSVSNLGDQSEEQERDSGDVNSGDHLGLMEDID